MQSPKRSAAGRASQLRSRAMFKVVADDSGLVCTETAGTTTQTRSATQISPMLVSWLRTNVGDRLPRHPPPIVSSGRGRGRPRKESGQSVAPANKNNRGRARESHAQVPLPSARKSDRPRKSISYSESLGDGPDDDDDDEEESREVGASDSTSRL